jgi:hypothetical protein
VQAVKDGALDAFVCRAGCRPAPSPTWRPPRAAAAGPRPVCGQAQGALRRLLRRRRDRGAGLPAHQAPVRPAEGAGGRPPGGPAPAAGHGPPRSPPWSCTRGPSATTTSRPGREGRAGPPGRRGGRGGRGLGGRGGGARRGGGPGGGGRRARPRGGQRPPARLGRVRPPYRHSAYRAEVTETFAAAGDGFRLVAVASPSEAVLDHYELEGRRTATGGWRRLVPAATPAWTPCPWSRRRSAAHPGGRRVPAAALRRGWRPGPLVLSVRP